MKNEEITSKVIDLSNEIINSGKFEEFKKNPASFLDNLNLNSEEIELASEISEDELEKISGGDGGTALVCATMIVVAIIQRPR